MVEPASRNDRSLDATSALEHDAIGRLERQVERASLLTHSIVGEHALRLRDLEGFVFGLIDVLLGKTLVTSAELEKAVERVQTEMVQDDRPTAEVAMRVDPQPASENVYHPVSCEERMPICRAVCCKLRFALSQDEIESGKVKWDLGQPYLIRHEANGFCSHNNRQTGGCGIYADRPRVCQSYSCAQDERIWENFEQMVLNQEWIDEHLSEASQRPVMVTFLGVRPPDDQRVGSE